MTCSKVVYAPRPDATLESELSALASVYQFVIERKEKAVPDRRPDDAERRSDEIGAKTSIQRIA